MSLLVGVCVYVVVVCGLCLLLLFVCGVGGYILM